LTVSTSVNAQFNKKITGNGNEITKTRTISDFDALGVAGSFDIILVQGNDNKVTIKADENLMEYIVTDVKNGSLKIKSKKGYNLKSRKTISITVTFDNLENVSLSGSGDITSDDVLKSTSLKLSLSGSGNISLPVDTGELSSNISGSGNIKLNGNSDKFSCAIAGSGNINAYDMKAGTTNAKIAGSGNVKVNAVNEIHAKIAGSGNVLYTGNPEVEKSNSAGSGSLKKKG